MNSVVKLVLFLIAISWVIVNVGGLVVAIRDSAGIAHLAIHIGLAMVSGIAAYLLRPARKRPPAIQADPRFELLQEDVSDLQLKLDEKQREQEFMEQLLAKRPDSHRDA